MKHADRTTGRRRGLPRLVLAAAMLASLASAAGAQTGNISGTNKYAWSENAGWNNFRPTGGGVTVYGDHLEGFAWAENIGWIRLGGTYDPLSSHPPYYNNNSNTNWGVNRSGTTLSGYAWSENAGWINFSPSGGGVSVAGTPGDFSGYAWGENVGWIRFNGSATDNTTYKVAALGSSLAEMAHFGALGLPEGVRLSWETRSEVDVAGFHVWRATASDAEYARLTGSLIPALGGPSEGAEYVYEDADAPLGEACLYQVEEVGYGGESAFHGPVEAEAGEAAPAREEPVRVWPERPARR